jgi:hypothetical protein
MENVNSIRDLGVEISGDLEPSAHVIDIVTKSQRKINLLMRVIKTKNPRIYRKAYVSLVRPLLEYASVVWCPAYKKDIEMIENVQRSFSRKVFARCGLTKDSYLGRIKFLRLTLLTGRRLLADLTLTYKIVTSNVDLRFDDFFVRYNGLLVGHGRKLFPHHIESLSRTDTQFNTLAHRVYKVWNDLPSAVVNSSTVSCFKRRLLKSLISLELL